MVTYKKASSLIEEKKVKFVDIKFIGLNGIPHSFTIPARNFTEKNIKKGFAFDGSSVSGFQNIYDSDLVVIPDKNALYLDPFHASTLIAFSDIYDPVKNENYPICPRVTAKKAEKYLKSSKIGDTSFWGPEIEFFVFDSLKTELSAGRSLVSIDSEYHNDFDEDDSYKVRTKGGYFSQAPFDKLHEYRNEMMEILEELGIEVECHHHEVATAGQLEIDIKYDTLVRMADKVILYKYIARNLAKKYGLVAVFLPKPIFGDNGSGMHTHQSIFKNGKNIFFDPKGYSELSQDALYYLSGILNELSSLLSISNPTSNSYRRLVPHYEAPTAIAYSQRNRSAAIRIPVDSPGNEKAKRLELRCPDPTANPYLAFSAMLVFGINGIKNKIDPQDKGFGPFDENIWEKSNVKQTPRSFSETLDALKKDSILEKSKVFSKQILENYYNLKMKELNTVLLFPTAADFEFYVGL